MAVSWLPSEGPFRDFIPPYPPLMKPYLHLMLALCCSFWGCQSGPQTIGITFKPATQKKQNDVPITLDRDYLAKLAGPIPAGKWLSLSVKNEVIPHQYNDWNGDGEWDEVFLLLNFHWDPQTLKVEFVGQKPKFRLPVRTHLHLGSVIVRDSLYGKLTGGNRVMGTETAKTISVYQFEGPGWENDHIAFRNYFDERNGMDIFGKKTTAMVLENVGTGENYHEMLPWGMDILKVANSLGAGALALQYQDSLYRVTDDSTSTCQFMVEGPLQSGFTFYFPSVRVGDTVVSITHTISIVAGANGYKSRVAVSPVLPGMVLVPGIVNLHSDSCYTAESGDLKMIYTHDKQAFEGEYLGMALMAPAASYLGHFTAPEIGMGITQTYGMELHLQADKPTEFWFLAGWEVENKACQSREGFLKMLDEEALKLASGTLKE